MKIDKKELAIEGRDVTLRLWDINGQDDFQTVQQSYLRGSSGYLLVVDGTRKATLASAIELQRTAAQVVGNAPFAVVLNKSDLESEWQVDNHGLWKLADQGASIVRTSAKTGEGVEQVFLKLAQAMLAS